MLGVKHSSRLIAALAAICCLLGAVRAVDIPSNVDFSNKDLPETGELMHGKRAQRDEERKQDASYDLSSIHSTPCYESCVDFEFFS